MLLFTKAELTKLHANAAKQKADPKFRAKPVVKLFYPAGAATWLISEIDPENPSQAFGLADLGQGHPELGYIDLNELTAFRGRFGLKIERDRWFTADRTLVEYADKARVDGRISA
jgi:hypothetical protein